MESNEEMKENAQESGALIPVKEDKRTVQVDASYLPNDIWENILARLPIASLFRMRSVCKLWNSMVYSESFLMAHKRAPPQDPFFFLFADYTQRNAAAAYNPEEDTWVVMSLSFMSSSCDDTSYRLHRGIASDGGLFLAEDRKGSLVISNLFTKSYKILPPMEPMKQPYVVAMVASPGESDEYKILVVDNNDKVTSQVYDSGSNSWKMSGSFDGRFALLGNAAHLDGVLFCLSHGPDQLLAFDIDAGTWDLVDIPMPSVVCPHILEYDGSLVLVGGVEEHGLLKRISIWQLDESAREWHIMCSMPDHLFSKFSHGTLNHFLIVGLWGRICFYKNHSPFILMYDLLENRWWWLPPCPLKTRTSRPSWFGLVLEPRLDATV